MSAVIVTSPRNPHAARLAALHARKGRKKHDSFLVEGFSIVEDALRSPCRVKTLVARDDVAGTARARRILKTAGAAGAAVVTVSARVFDGLTTRETPQGIAAEVAAPPPRAWSETPAAGLGILMERLGDPRNAGLLFRTALAAGAGAVFLTRGSVDPFNPAAVQTSMGAVLFLPIHPDSDPAAVIGHFRRSGGKCFAALPRGGKRMDRWTPPPPPVLFAFGNEASGVSKELLKLCDGAVTVPLFGGAESLNVAVAAGILCCDYMIRRPGAA
ncbi:MAG: RNA methyltransferase [bacterium]